MRENLIKDIVKLHKTMSAISALEAQENILCDSIKSQLDDIRDLDEFDKMYKLLLDCKLKHAMLGDLRLKINGAIDVIMKDSKEIDWSKFNDAIEAITSKSESDSRASRSNSDISAVES